jgi:hypothetical protein
VGLSVEAPRNSECASASAERGGGERRTRAGGLSATRAFLSFSPPTRAKRPAERLGPPSPALYACAAAVNFALRVSWSLQLSARYALDGQGSSSLSQALELARRALWTVLRFEREHWDRGGGSKYAH